MASQFADYKAAEVTGRLMFNPYRVGDTVYVYADGEIKEETVKQIFVDDRGAFLSTLGHFCGSVNSFSNFGKTVFPTREAAEETLKRLEGVNRGETENADL